MYNNLSQPSPYAYSYNMPGYQRAMPVQNEAQIMPQQQSYMAQMIMPQTNYIKGRPVVSIDEARASQIDLDGSLYVFPDLGNKKIYTKQINMDGTATFNVFELSGANEGVQAPTYVTRAELDEILASFKNTLDQEKAREPVSTPKLQANKPFNL